MHIRMIFLTGLALVAAALPAGTSRAVQDLPPARGGTTYSLGMPPVYKGRAGFEMQWYRPQNNNELAGFVSAGVAKDLGSPVVGIAALRAEGYGGFRGESLDGGARVLFEIPSFYVGVGVDWNATDTVTDLLLTLDLPLRRGGVFGRGTTLAVRWLPARDQTFSLGINVPLWGRNIGETRPMSDNVRLQKRHPERLVLAEPPTALVAALADLAERARWVARLAQPFAEPEGADAAEAMAPDLALIKAHVDSTDLRFPDGHTLPAEIAAYHGALDLAFSLALGADRDHRRRAGGSPPRPGRWCWTRCSCPTTASWASARPTTRWSG